MDSNYVPTLQTTLTPPIEIEVEREKRKVSLEFSPVLEVDRSKFKTEQSLNIFTFNKEESGVPIYNATIDLKNIYRRTLNTLYNADVVEESITYSYKDSNGKESVMEVVKLRSCDLVSNAATTWSLFESHKNLFESLKEVNIEEAKERFSGILHGRNYVISIEDIHEAKVQFRKIVGTRKVRKAESARAQLRRAVRR